MSEGIDSGIVEAVRQFVAKSNACREPPGAVTWSDRYSVDQYSLSGRQLVFPRALRERLRAEEWAPLLSFLLLRRYSRNVIGLLFRALTWLIALLIILIVSVVVFFNVAKSPDFTQLSLFVAYLYAIIMIDVFTVLRTIPKYSRDAWFAADKEAARFYGKDFILKVMTKIGSNVEPEKLGKRESLFARWSKFESKNRKLNFGGQRYGPAQLIHFSVTGAYIVVASYNTRGNKSGYGTFADADRIFVVRSWPSRAPFLLGPALVG